MYRAGADGMIARTLDELLVYRKAQDACRLKTVDYNFPRAGNCGSRCGRPVLPLARAARARGRRSEPRPSDRYQCLTARRRQRHHHLGRTEKRNGGWIAAHRCVDPIDGGAGPWHLLWRSIVVSNNAGWDRQAELFEGIRAGEIEVYPAEVEPDATIERGRSECAVRRGARWQPGVGQPWRFR